jgi:hypothetical protein
MNIKLTANQRSRENSSRCWQLDVEKIKHKIDWMVSAHQRLCSVNQELIEENELLAIDRQY